MGIFFIQKTCIGLLNWNQHMHTIHGFNEECSLMGLSNNSASINIRSLKFSLLSMLVYFVPLYFLPIWKHTFMESNGLRFGVKVLQVIIAIYIYNKCLIGTNFSHYSSNDNYKLLSFNYLGFNPL